MNSSGIAFGHAASHSAWLEQLPKSSRAMAATMFSVLTSRSGWPCGSAFKWVTFAAVNSMAAALGQAATQAPQPMHAAASKAVSAASFGTRMALASGALPVGAVM